MHPVMIWVTPLSGVGSMRSYVGSHPHSIKVALCFPNNGITTDRTLARPPKSFLLLMPLEYPG